MSDASENPSPSLSDHLNAASQQPADLKSETDAAPPSAATDAGRSTAANQEESAQHAQQGSADLTFKDELMHTAQQGSLHEMARQGHAEHAELKADNTEEMAGDIGMMAEREEGHDSDEEGAEGQRLTRSRRGNAAGLYMLDHGSQLIPKKASFFLLSVCLSELICFEQDSALCCNLACHNLPLPAGSYPL